MLWHIPLVLDGTHQTFKPKELVYGYNQQRYTWAPKRHRHNTMRHCMQLYTEFEGMVPAVQEPYQTSSAVQTLKDSWGGPKGAGCKGLSAIAP